MSIIIHLLPIGKKFNDDEGGGGLNIQNRSGHADDNVTLYTYMYIMYIKVYDIVRETDDMA